MRLWSDDDGQLIRQNSSFTDILIPASATGAKMVQRHRPGHPGGQSETANSTLVYVFDRVLTEQYETRKKRRPVSQSTKSARALLLLFPGKYSAPPSHLHTFFVQKITKRISSTCTAGVASLLQRRLNCWSFFACTVFNLTVTQWR